jgi:dienelactone hydrolase
MRFVARCSSALLLACLTFGCSERSSRPHDDAAAGGFSIKAADGVTVYGDLYEGPRGDKGPVVLLFHQAGSSAAEYEPIAPRLVQEGFSCLAVDQRSGGDMFGRNRTVEANGFRTPQLYEAAYADLVAALDWAVQKGYDPIIVWGSSYSASLCLRLAAEREEVDAVLAFSPGEYFNKEGLVADWAARVTVPVFVASSPGEVDKASAIFERISSKGSSQFVPDEGVHGSSMLRPDKNPRGAEEAWRAVLSFLRRYVEYDV